VEVVTAVVACGGSSFKLEHKLTLKGVLAVEGYETRVWAVRDPADPKRIKSQPLPAELVAKLTQMPVPSS
jgi:4-hydroxybenzoyl-CoA thioesterase